MTGKIIHFNWPLIGNEQITEFLEKSAGNNKISGSYIFSGPDNIGKSTVANSFAQALLCEIYVKGAGIVPCGDCPSCGIFGSKNKMPENGVQDIFSTAHSDLIAIKPDKEKRDISIEQIREFIRRLSMSSFMGKFKIGIIKHAEKLNMNSANALLKTLEEPRPNTVILLVTSDIDALPQTIVSRSQVFNFRPVRTDMIYDFLINEKGASRSLAKRYARAALGRPALASKFLENVDFRERYRVFVETFLTFGVGDLNARFKKIDSILGPRASGQSAVRTATRTLEVWEGLARDLLLSAYSLPDLVQHESILNELQLLVKKFDPKRILDLFGRIREAKEYLRSNVNPRLVLEYIAINF